MKPYIAVLLSFGAWAVTGCLELDTQTSSASSSGGTSSALCGNGNIDPGEECDDGNKVPGDECSPNCRFEFVTSLVVGSPGISGIVDGTGTNAQLSGPTSMTLFGNTLYLGDDTTVRAVDIDTATIKTIAGIPGSLGYTDSVDGVTARFNDIKGLATDGKTLWIADMENHVIRTMSLTPPNTVMTIAGSGIPGQSIDGVGSAARLDSPRGLVYFNGYVYFVDGVAVVLRRLTPSTGEVITLAGQAYMQGLQDGKGPEALFTGPRSLVDDGMGHLYIADTDGRSIRKYDINTTEVTTIGGTVACGYLDGPALMAQMYAPRGISFHEGNLYFAEYQANTIRQLVLDVGSVFTISGTPASCAATCACPAAGAGGYLEGSGSVAQWNGPYDTVYHAPSKSIFVSDARNYVIRRLK